MFQIIQMCSSIDKIAQLLGSLYSESYQILAIDDEKIQTKAMDQLTLIVTCVGNIQNFVSKYGILNTAQIYSSNPLRKFSHQYSQNQMFSTIIMTVDRSSVSVDSISYTIGSSGGCFYILSKTN